MSYFFNYLTEAVRDKLNWLKKVINAMVEVDKTGKSSKSSRSKLSMTKAKNNKKIHRTSPVKEKPNLNSSGKASPNKLSSQKIKGIKNGRVYTSPKSSTY